MSTSASNMRTDKKKYPDWVHFSGTLRHTVRGVSWMCLDIFLHVLNQPDLTLN